MMANSAASLANPWIAGQLTQSIIGEPVDGFPAFQLILLGWLALIVAKNILGFAVSYLVGTTGSLMSSRLRTRVYEHLQILPLAYFQERRQGEMLTLLSNDSDMISNFVTNTLVQLLPLVLTFVGALFFMARLDPLVALMALLLMPIYFLAMKVIGRKIRPLTTEWTKSWTNMVTLAQENLGLMPAIKAFIREPLEAQRFEHRSAELLKLSRRQIFAQSSLAHAISFLAGSGLLLLLWVGISHVRHGQLEPAQLVSLLLYALLLTQPASGLANVYGDVMRTRGAAERLLEFFGVQAEPISMGLPPIGKVKGAVDYRDITFAYPGRVALFEHFNLSVAAGETVALVGANGAGKTTLAHLLLRFIEPSRGHILIDGIDIRDVDIASLRSQIGLVAQHTLLLNGTVAENIAYGNPQATTQEMKKAASAARAETFIDELVEGYDTVIGDQGIKLSGGQRQRLSLARTFLMDPPILILDEATAMFDPEGEKDFLRECLELLQQRTVILITHRSSSLELADRIIRL